MYKLLPTTLPDQAGQQWETLPGTFVITRDGKTTTRELPLLLDTGRMAGDAGNHAVNGTLSVRF